MQQAFVTPIVKATRVQRGGKTEVKQFMTLPEYRQWLDSLAPGEVS